MHKTLGKKRFQTKSQLDEFVKSNPQYIGTDQQYLIFKIVEVLNDNFTYWKVAGYVG